MPYPKEFEAAIKDPRFSHTRVRSWCGCQIVYAYHADAGSPSGVVLAAGLDERLAEPILRKHRKSGPLSPVEPR